jgi:hypothetical protein
MPVSVKRGLYACERCRVSETLLYSCRKERGTLRSRKYPPLITGKKNSIRVSHIEILRLLNLKYPATLAVSTLIISLFRNGWNSRFFFWNNQKICEGKYWILKNYIQFIKNEKSKINKLFNGHVWKLPRYYGYLVSSRRHKLPPLFMSHGHKSPPLLYERCSWI